MLLNCGIIGIDVLMHLQNPVYYSVCSIMFQNIYESNLSVKEFHDPSDVGVSLWNYSPVYTLDQVRIPWAVVVGRKQSVAGSLLQQSVPPAVETDLYITDWGWKIA